MKELAINDLMLVDNLFNSENLFLIYIGILNYYSFEVHFDIGFENCSFAHSLHEPSYTTVES